VSDKPKRYLLASITLGVLMLISFLLAREIMKAHAHDDDAIDDAGIR
jgi:hypothetical protein